jgi:hypothetical protein
MTGERERKGKNSGRRILRQRMNEVMDMNKGE